MGEQEQGAYYEVRLRDGSVVSGTAADEQHARYLMQSLRESLVIPVYTCANPECRRGVAWSHAHKRWYHALMKDHPTKCPGLGTEAMPAPPAERRRDDE